MSAIGIADVFAPMIEVSAQIVKVRNAKIPRSPIRTPSGKVIPFPKLLEALGRRAALELQVNGRPTHILCSDCQALVKARATGTINKYCEDCARKRLARRNRDKVRRRRQRKASHPEAIQAQAQKEARAKARKVVREAKARERTKARSCADCPTTVTGQARRCPSCIARRSYLRSLEKDPDGARARRREVDRKWRNKDPARTRALADKRRATLKAKRGLQQHGG